MGNSNNEDQSASSTGDHSSTFSTIRNKQRREQVYQEYKLEKAKRKSALRKTRAKEEAANPEKRAERLAQNVPKTLENTREYDETYVEDGDMEVEEEEEQDEFAQYFNGQSPKILLTTSKIASKASKSFATDLLTVFPNSRYVRRGKYRIQQIIEYCNNREFTDIIVVHEDHKQPFALTIFHLPGGPTAHFKLSNITLMKDIEGRGKVKQTPPELILNNFTTRLGHTVGRFFAALFPQVPKFEERQVATFHNQRDFIFFRRHRYAFRSGEKADLQEIGPRFTLKLKWLQKGPYDPKHGEYEWVFQPKMATSRRRFFL
ncbi:Ribosome production factor 1 [Dispira simplex]|nr:Ribosome production factor 1 [Dispira simplex]